MAITKIEVPELFDFGSDNSAFKLPTGTTAERPTSPSNGEMRFNTTTGYVEYYDTTDTQWWEIDYAPILPSENFNTVLYNGDSVNASQSSTSVTTVGFQPDFTWIKARDNGSNNHALTDSVRGTGSGNGLSSNTTGAEGQYSAAYGYLSAFSTDGFTVTGGTTSSGFVNNENTTYVAWSWKAGGSSNTFNKNGTGHGTASAAGLTGESNITIQGSSVNTESGISIIKTLTGPSTGMIIPHGLGTQPELIISKPLNTSLSWYTWTPILNNGSTSSNTGWSGLFLDTTAAASSSAYVYASNTHIYDSWAVGRLMVYYSFISVAGYSKIGSYVGTGATGNTIVTGFEPAFLMTKRTDVAGYNWYMWDNKRSPSNPRDEVLQADTSSAEVDYSAYPHDFNSNGFTIDTNNTAFNGSGATYIFMAFAANPT